MKKIISLILTTGALSTCAFVFVVKSEQAGKPKEKVFPWDNGPATIDVSKYPKEQQDNYKVLEKKCQKCHVLARAINAPYSAIELEEYVKKMMKKARAGVDAKSAAKITEFLKYDSTVRKRERFWDKSEEKHTQK